VICGNCITVVNMVLKKNAVIASDAKQSRFDKFKLEIASSQKTLLAMTKAGSSKSCQVFV
jgi:hypothetical protein